MDSRISTGKWMTNRKMDLRTAPDLEALRYTGCALNFKTFTSSIWHKKQRDNSLEKRSILTNAHNPIIEDDVF